MTILPATLLLAGCIGFPTQPGLDPSNPASPSAAEAPYSPGPPLMMTGSNYAMSAEGEGQPMQTDMKMNMPAHESELMKESGHEGHHKPSSEPEAGGQHEHHQHNEPKQ